MAATQQDTDDRWQLALELARENTQRYQDLVKIVQAGFGSLGTEVDGLRRELRNAEADIKAVRATDQDCQQRLARLEADGAARAVLMRWLLTFGMVNAIGAVIVAALLIYMLSRLFSLAG